MKSIVRVRQNLLNQLLNLPQLVQNIQALPPEKFHLIITEIGLEDSGELVSLATAAQLQELFDIDLWTGHTPGDAEQFDSQRFMRWFEILLEAGESVLLEKVMKMDEELLFLGLAPQLFVLPTELLDAFFQTADHLAYQVDTKLESCIYEELYTYQVFSRNPENFDVIISLFMAMDIVAHSKLLQILSQLAGLGESQVEEEALYTVLSDLEAMADNVADKRDERRSAKGYISSQDARAFLRLGEVNTMQQLIESSEPDAITTAYFRRFNPDTNASPPEATVNSYAAIWEVMEAAQLIPSNPETSPRLPGKQPSNQERLLLALQQLGSVSKTRFGQLSAELGYLGNVLMAGCTLNQRQFRSVEASTAVTATCALGMETCLQQTDIVANKNDWVGVLKCISMIQLFLIGWKRIAGHDCRAFPFYTDETCPSTHCSTIRFFDSITS